MQPMQRRENLRQLGLAALALVMPAITSHVYAAPAAADARFLLVFLRGGYDAASVLVPASSEFYYTSRPNISVRAPITGGAATDPLAASALDGGNGWALHPALRDTVLPLWLQKQLAFVPFAGTHDLSRSHFETQDTVEGGLPLSGDRQVGTVGPLGELAAVDATGASGGTNAAVRGTGFLNRLATALGSRAAPVAFTDGMPLAMAGPQVVPNLSLKGTGRTPFDARQTALFADLYRGTRFESLIAEGFELRQTVAQEAEAMQKRGASRMANAAASAAASPAGMADTVAARMQEMDAANRRALSARGFEVEARRMAALMRDRFNLGFIDVGGWDTHVNQGAGQGQLANLLDNLGRGIAGFADEMGPAWNKTVVVVVSEFGRTMRENGTRGTDHGHGTTYWVAGGKVFGGQIAGEQVAVEARTLNQNRDLPVLNDYRAVLGCLFGRLYGLNGNRLAQVFPGCGSVDIGLL